MTARPMFHLKVCAAVILLLLAPGAHATCRDVDIFEVYDRLMPLSDVTEAPAPEIVTLRYIPGDTSIAREAKIMLRELPNGEIAGEAWVPAGERSIQQQFRELRAARPSDCDEALVAFLSVERHELTGKDVTALYRSLRSMKVAVVPESAIYLDAARYEFVIEGQMNKYTFALSGPTGRTTHPLIRWADTLLKTALASHIRVR